MKRDENYFKALVLSLGIVGVLGFSSGCSNVPMHAVSVDAISDGPVKFSGISYRLLPRDPVLTRETLQYNLAILCVNTALAGRGMYAVAENARPDLLIELDYGEAPMLVLPGAPREHELYLQLSARNYRENEPARNYKGEEIWNVRVSVKNRNPSLELVLPLLAAAATDYAGIDHQPDNSVRIPDNSPTIVAVKNAVVSQRGAKPGS